MASTGTTPQTAKPQNRAIERRADPKTQQLASLIESRKAAFALVAGKHFQPERLVKLAQGALARTPKIAQCTPASVLVALMRCAELDLEPDSALPQRRMWLVPRWSKKLNANECTYLMDYRAQIQKARESGLVKSIVATEVRQNDHFQLDYDVDGVSITKFEFRPGGEAGPFSDRGAVIGYFAAARIDGGEVQIALMSKKVAEAFRDKYGPRNRDDKLTGPWVGGDDQFDEMAIKTCLRKLWKLLPAGKTDEARKLQERMSEEGEIDEGRKSVQSTAPVELDLGVPAEEIESTDSAVERALGAGPAAAEGGTPADDVQFETAEEERARRETEAKANAEKLTQTLERAQEHAREPGDDQEEEFSR